MVIINLYNDITYEVEFILLRNDLILDTPNLKPIPKKSKITSNIYKKLLSFAKEQTKNPESIYMNLFYTGAEKFKTCRIEIVNNLSLHEIKGNIIFKTKIRYIFSSPILLSDIKKEVKDIFKHWSKSSDVEYSLKKFKIIDKKNISGYIRTNGLPIYHNVY
jgi:hypothetical protein